MELPAPPRRRGETPHLLAPSLIAICDRESNGKQHDETPTVYKTPSLPLRPMLRAPQPPESDTARRPLHGDAASSRVLYQGGGASSSAIATRRDAASPCFIHLASHPKETHTPVATASRLAFGSGDMSRCVIPTRRDAASPCAARPLNDLLDKTYPPILRNSQQRKQPYSGG